MLLCMQHSDLLESIFRLTPPQKTGLRKLGLKTVRDLLYHFPSRYDSIAEIRTINTLTAGDDAVMYGKITGLRTRKTWKNRMAIAEGWIEDSSGKMKVVWFHQPFIARLIKDGAYVKLGGHVSGNEKGVYLANPEIETVSELPIDSHESLFGEGNGESTHYAMYPESRGITSQWFRHALKKILSEGILDTLTDPIPNDILERYHLPALTTALLWIHTPREENHARTARKRFAFEEIFLIQLGKIAARKMWEKEPTLPIRVERDRIQKEFISRFAFTPTRAQHEAIETILQDFNSSQGNTHAMARLLEGDVGSGKTFVAATTAYAVVTTCPQGQNFGTLQVAYMAPTEILAKQHFESFITFFEHLPVHIALITGSGCRKFPSKTNPRGWTGISRAQLLKWVQNGEIAIVIGTHALIQKSVKFKNLAYVIIDEQHRFGTSQRRELIRKDAIVPHLLSMTATPIPRTLALTMYGDLDLTILDEMPQGRRPIITEIVLPNRREATYEKIKKELAALRQAYVICPRIDEPDPTKLLAIQAKSVKEEAKRLKKEVFQEFEIGVLHGKMKPKEKDSIMSRFAEGKIDILVATSVVEVGVNVPNATVILIEGAERYGLSQLHQLRGRVLRSNHQAYCYIFTENSSKTTLERLKALTTAKNGFELSEFDLAIRGAGELSGVRQSGLSDMGMEALKNIKMVEAARNEAARILDSDPDLSEYSLLRERSHEKAGDVHFE